MTDLQKGVLVLLQAGLTGKVGQLPEGFSPDAAFETIKSHQVVGLCYEGAVLCGVDKGLPVMQTMFALSCRLLVVGERQQVALQQVFAAFEEAGFDYLPVKGAVLKKLYPRQELRVMGDADILIRKEQYARVAALMEKLGFENTEHTQNVQVWKNKHVMLELHDCLVPPDEAEYVFYKNTWSRAVHQQDCRYGLSREEEYTFTFVHYVKHYRHGGIGLRQLTDLWLLETQWADMDWGYIETELAQMGLVTFWQNTRAMLRSWFADEQETEVTAWMTEYIFSGGSWGNFQRAAAAQGLRNSGASGSGKAARFKMLMAALFPNLDWMQRRYKVLRKLPILLPVIWPVRWVEAALFRRKNIRSAQNVLKNASDEQIEQMRRGMELVGLK